MKRFLLWLVGVVLGVGIFLGASADLLSLVSSSADCSQQVCRA